VATPLPTTPTVEHALNLLAQNADRSHGLPIWAQVLLPLVTAAVAFGVAATGRGHDRTMRLKDDAREELLVALDQVLSAELALRKMLSLLPQIERYRTYQSEMGAERYDVAARSVAGWSVADYRDQLNDAVEEIVTAGVQLDARYDRVTLLVPSASGPVVGFANVRRAYRAIRTSCLGLAHGGIHGEDFDLPQTLQAVDREFDAFTAARREFGHAARDYVQPEPSLWQQTATKPAI
jgi:hypothetical protein